MNFLWVDPDDCVPPHGLDLETDRDANKVNALALEFKSNGFSLKAPALVGYPKDGKLQLLSGTHRHLAAKIAGIKLPITIWLRSYVETAWGTEHWNNIIADIPVSQLTKHKATGDLWDDLKNIEPIDPNTMYG